MTEQPPVGSKPLMEGFLTKQSAWLKEWRRRHFALHANQLYFFSERGAKAHGVIDLSRCITVKSADEKTGKRFSFEVSVPSETFFLHADSEADKDAWIGAIGKAIVMNSRGAYMRGPAHGGGGGGHDEDDDDDDDD